MDPGILVTRDLNRTAQVAEAVVSGNPMLQRKKYIYWFEWRNGTAAV